MFESFFLIFASSALIATFAMYTKQPILVAYIIAGVALGPYGYGVISDLSSIADISHIGIVFLLFLMGLDMQPSALKAVLKQVTHIAIISSILFFGIGFTIGYVMGFGLLESSIIAMATMFSSTIIGIKLLPTTVLHHKHTGELMIGLLLLQDFLAIMCLLLLLSANTSGIALNDLGAAFIALPLLAVGAFVFVKYGLLTLIQRFDRIHEYIFLIAIAWCLSLAAIAEHVYLSAEIGAFIAGISLATSPIAQFITLNLKPLRDFFLVMFFFAVGAELDITLLPNLLAPAIILAIVVLTLKPVIYFFLLRRQSEKPGLAWDIGFRLGQTSEFSLLIAFVAIENHLISKEASFLIQASTLISFIVSSYIVTFKFPNPLAVNDKLRRD